MSAVPIYDASGRLLSFASAEWVERNEGNLRIVRNRRGHAKRCYLRAADGELVQWLAATGRRSSFGRGFRQPLLCGRVVWALKGVRGSGR